MRLCTAASCAALLFAGVAAARARPMGHMSSPHQFMGQGHLQHPSHGHFRGDHHRHFRHQPIFGLGYGQTPYLSGTFPSGPIEEGAPPIPDEYPAYYEPRPQPCVVPLLIELKHRQSPKHMPRITYGSPSFCPPPFVAEAY
jgi:hypothetical protein